VSCVLGDADRLQQVVWNLLSNAIKFTNSGGSVSVQASQLGDEVELVVKDTGEGIAPEFLPKIFERFQQADGKRRREGLGLGLAIVKELVELHGGTIDVYSAGKGKGAEFRARLPKHRPSAVDVQSGSAPSNPELRVASALAGKQVLVVDDDADARQVLKRVLNRHGVDVVTADSAARARELLEAYQPDVITCDLDMPDIDGLEFVKEIRSQQRFAAAQLPMVALTASASEEDRRRALESGFQQHLSKPVEPRELVSALAELALSP
jgi:CheY-like chemotaxis protein